MWFLITRHRPDAVARVIEAMGQCGEWPNNVAVIIDDDSSRYDLVKFPDTWAIHRTPYHMELSQAANWGLQLYPDESFYGILGDYVRPQTGNWNIHLEEAAGEWGVACCRDNWMNGKRQDGSGKFHLSGAICLGRKFVHALGYIFHPNLVHLFVDDVIEDLAIHFELNVYLDEVVVDVDRPETTKRPRDLNHRREYQGRPFSMDDKKNYELWRKGGGFDADCEKLRRYR